MKREMAYTSAMCHALPRLDADFAEGDVALCEGGDIYGIIGCAETSYK